MTATRAHIRRPHGLATASDRPGGRDCGVMSCCWLQARRRVPSAYVPVYGEGSSWSANALDQWISDVQHDGMRINYIANGSTAGREAFIDGQTDFAASDIPFQTDPNDGSAPENPAAGSYAYMPITAGGTVFMYNLKIDGQQVTNLRLSGENIAKIFTGADHQLGQSGHGRRQSGPQAAQPDRSSRWSAPTAPVRATSCRSG